MLMGKGGDMNTIQIIYALVALLVMATAIAIAQYETAKEYKAMAQEFCLSASGGEENVCKEVLK